MDADVYSSMRDIQRDHWWYRGRRHIIARQIEQLDLPQGARILEAGCGPGGNIDMLAGFGTVDAFDPSSLAIDFAGQTRARRLAIGSLPDAIPFDDDYDLVTAFDVLEHVQDDHDAIMALTRRLKPGGRLILTVPAHPVLWSEHDERNHHFRRYTPPAFRRLVAHTGLSIVKFTSFNAHLAPLIAGLRLYRTLLGKRGYKDETLPSPRVNSLLEAIFKAEAGVLAWGTYPVGISLLAVLEASRTTTPTQKEFKYAA